MKALIYTARATSDAKTTSFKFILSSASAGKREKMGVVAPLNKLGRPPDRLVSNRVASEHTPDTEKLCQLAVVISDWVAGN